MPRGKLRPTLEEVKALLAEDQDLLRPLVQAVLQELLEAEMTEALGAAKGARTPARLGYRSGYYERPDHPGRQAGGVGCRRTARAASRPRCSSAASARRRRWWRRSRRCASRSSLTPKAACA